MAQNTHHSLFPIHCLCVLTRMTSKPNVILIERLLYYQRHSLCGIGLHERSNSRATYCIAGNIGRNFIWRFCKTAKLMLVGFLFGGYRVNVIISPLVCSHYTFHAKPEASSFRTPSISLFTHWSSSYARDGTFDRQTEGQLLWSNEAR